jgi:hypothetical protein
MRIIALVILLAIVLCSVVHPESSAVSPGVPGLPVVGNLDVCHAHGCSVSPETGTPFVHRQSFLGEPFSLTARAIITVPAPVLSFMPDEIDRPPEA